MPRAGSGWHYNLVHDLLVAAGGQDARQVRRRYHLESILTEVNCNIGALTPVRLLPVLLPSLLGNTFAVKAHAGPTPLALSLMRTGKVRSAYIYRDPRDAMLSAYEHGERSRHSAHENAFARLDTFEETLSFMQDYIRTWDAWMSCELALCARYEDLLEDYDTQALRLVDFLEIEPHIPSVQAVLEKYRPEQTRASAQKGLHFRKGKIGRFRNAYTPEQQAACLAAFGSALERMGYEL